MPYVFTGNCPKCGAPIFVAVNPNDPEEYPEISYNCNCCREERKRGSDCPDGYRQPDHLELIPPGGE